MLYKNKLNVQDSGEANQREEKQNFMWHSSCHVCENAAMMIFNYYDENNDDSAVMFLR